MCLKMNSQLIFKVFISVFTEDNTKVSCWEHVSECQFRSHNAPYLLAAVAGSGIRQTGNSFISTWELPPVAMREGVRVA